MIFTLSTAVLNSWKHYGIIHISLPVTLCMSDNVHNNAVLGI